MRDDLSGRMGHCSGHVLWIIVTGKCFLKCQILSVMLLLSNNIMYSMATNVLFSVLNTLIHQLMDIRLFSNDIDFDPLSDI